MNERLLEIEIRGRIAAADLADDVRARLGDQRGQTTVEWLALMVGVTALVTILAGDDVWGKAAKAVVQAVDSIFSTDNDRV